MNPSSLIERRKGREALLRMPSQIGTACSAKMRGVRWPRRLAALAAGLALFVTPLTRASAGDAPAATQIVAYADQAGHHLYVSSDDWELRSALKSGGVKAGLSVVERRKRSLPGIDGVIEATCRSYAVDPKLVRAVIDVESAWNPNAVSSKGALGLMQLLPGTGARFGVRHFFEPEENVSGGVKYLHFLLDRFAGNLDQALAGYYAGENAVDLRGGIPRHADIRSYVSHVEARYRELAGDTAHNIHATQEDGKVLFVNY